MTTTRTVATAAVRATEPCALCGSAPQSPASQVTAVVRSVVLVYCSSACCEDHLATLALEGGTCAAAGCDLDPAGDVPFCDEHLDPAAA